jgi:hypothetical protein
LPAQRYRRRLQQARGRGDLFEQASALDRWARPDPATWTNSALSASDASMAAKMVRAIRQRRVSRRNNRPIMSG